jgi:alanine racemase
MLLYQTHTVVHLNNIAANIQAIRKHVGSERKILIAVKANAYGHGSVAVSRMAEEIGVSWLGVATVPEGIEIREAEVKLPILKFSPAFPEEMEAAIAHNITLTVCDTANAASLNAAATHANRNIRVHLKIDTGMGRIGAPASDAVAFAEFIRHKCQRLNVEGIFTHLPVSDEPHRDSFTKSQLALFSETVTRMEQALGYKVELVHAANSGGVLAHPESWLSMVRPGIMIYGFYPGGDTPKTVPLKPGLSLLSKISFVKKIKAGTPIGYGGTWVAPHDTTIATIPAGYADGFNRLFSNCGHAIVKGKKYPIVGRVCMDQSMIDLGPDSFVAPGDTVTLIGRDGDAEITVEDWAKTLKTISYEVTCQINSRVQRLYQSLTVGQNRFC